MADDYDAGDGGMLDEAGGTEPQRADTAGLARFTLKMDSVKNLFYAASSIYNGRKDAQALFTANCKGLKISVENQSKSMLATCMLKREQFAEFHIEQARGEMTEVRFRASLAHVLECFAIYGKDSLPLTAVHMGYDEAEGTLQMLLEEGGVTTECVLKTTDFGGEEDEATADKDYDAAFKSEPIVAKLVLMSGVLHDCVRELAEVPGADGIRVKLDRSELSLWTCSGSCTMEVKLPQNSDAMLGFKVDDAPGQEPGKPIEFTYHIGLWAAQLRALGAAEQSMVRINARGMLSAVHKLLLDGSGSGLLVSFHVSADEATDDAYVYEAVPAHEGGRGGGEDDEDDAGGGGGDDDGMAANAYGLEGGGEDVDVDAAAVPYVGGDGSLAPPSAGGGGHSVKRRRTGGGSGAFDTAASSAAASGGAGGYDEDDYGDIDQYR